MANALKCLLMVKFPGARREWSSFELDRRKRCVGCGAEPSRAEHPGLSWLLQFGAPVEAVEPGKQRPHYVCLCQFTQHQRAAEGFSRQHIWCSILQNEIQKDSMSLRLAACSSQSSEPNHGPSPSNFNEEQRPLWD